MSTNQIYYALMIYSGCQNNVPIETINLFEYGCECEPQKIHHGLRECPGQTINIEQAQTIKGFVNVYTLGLHCFHGCEYGAVDEGHIIVSVDRIRTHTQTEYIYDNYYNALCRFVQLSKYTDS